MIRSPVRFLRDARGAITVELAIVLPLFVLFLAFMAQGGLTLIQTQQMGRALSDATFVMARAGAEGLPEGQATLAALSVLRAVGGVSDAGDYKAYLRRIDITDSGPVQVWSAEAGSLDDSPDGSKIRIVDGALQLPGSLSLQEGDRVFVAEMYRRHVLAIDGVGGVARTYEYRILVR